MDPGATWEVRVAALLIVQRDLRSARVEDTKDAVKTTAGGLGVDPKEEKMAAIETGVGVLQVLHGARKKRGADEEDERERDLNDRQR